jgi:hypothetical protein
MDPNLFSAERNTYLYTKGKEFILDLDEYVGEYHIIGGIAFTGPYGTIESKQLTKYNPDKSVLLYNRVKPREIKVDKLRNPDNDAIYPTAAQYQNGVFVRYFIKSKDYRDPVIYEINSDEAKKFGTAHGIDHIKNQMLNINWAITKNEDKLEEVIFANKKTLIQANKDMPGLNSFITSYYEYSEIII